MIPIRSLFFSEEKGRKGRVGGRVWEERKEQVTQNQEIHTYAHVVEREGKAAALMLELGRSRNKQVHQDRK